MSSAFEAPASYHVQFTQPVGSNNRIFLAEIPIFKASSIHVAVGRRRLGRDEYEIVEANAVRTVVKLAFIPRAGTQITVWSLPELARKTNFLSGQSIVDHAVSTESAQLVASMACLSEILGRSLRIHETDALSSQRTLPDARQRAGRLLAFDSNGDLQAETSDPSAPMHLSSSVLLDEATAGSFPQTRPDGTALTEGDLVRDASDGTLYAYHSNGWAPVFAAASDYLSRSGENALSGALNLGGGALTGVASIAGRKVADDGIVLESSDRLSRNFLSRLAEVTEWNSWNLESLIEPGPGSIASLYLDDFDTVAGVASGMPRNRAIWNDLDCGDIIVRNAGRDATQSGSSSTFQFIAANAERRFGRLYAEITHQKSKAVASAHTWHGIRLVGTTDVFGNPPPNGYILCSNDGGLFDGRAEVPRPASFAGSWPQNYIMDDTRGAVAVDIDRGLVWLGFVDSSLTTWWHGGGDPETRQHPSARFQPGTPVTLAGGLWGGDDFSIRINAGQDLFQGSVPLGFRDGWHDGDEDTLSSEHVLHDVSNGTVGPAPRHTAVLDPSTDWTQTPRWYGYRDPVVHARSYLGRPSWVMETGGGGSPTMLHFAWTNEENLKLVNATTVEIETTVAASHMTSSGAGYGTHIQTSWVDNHDTPSHFMGLGAYLLGGRVQALYHPGASVSDPCPSVTLEDDTWYRLTWRLSKEPGFTAAEQHLQFMIDGAVVWSGTFDADANRPVENGVWAGSNDGLQFFHQHDGYPFWTSAVSTWTVRTSFDPAYPMVLYSRRINCADMPSLLRIAVDLDNLSDLQENDDFILSVSRNDGGDWQDLNLQRSTQLAPDRWILSAAADLLEAPNGDQVRVRLRTVNGASPILHRWRIAADQPFIS